MVRRRKKNAQRRQGTHIVEILLLRRMRMKDTEWKGNVTRGTTKVELEGCHKCALRNRSSAEDRSDTCANCESRYHFIFVIRRFRGLFKGIIWRLISAYACNIKDRIIEIEALLYRT